MKRPLLLPLVPLYALGVAWKSGSYGRHPEHMHRLQDPVISVGSLSAGGAGKTPFVIALGEALRRAGYGIDVLSRGHGRTSTADLRVQPSGGVAEFGDEPILIAKRLGCPVYVARERFRAGQMAERDRRHLREDRTLSVHLLDDGFQHRQLARAVDIVLFTAADAQDTLLPAGDLREPLSALRRASIIALRADEADTLRPVLQRVFRNKELPPVWITERTFAFVEGQPSARPLAFCGIARPEGFGASLANKGVTPVDLVRLRDHQPYDDRTMQDLITRGRKRNADGFVTTAKDAVKLTPKLRQQLEDVGPLAVGDIRVTLQNEEQCIADAIAGVKAWWAAL